MSICCILGFVISILLLVAKYSQTKLVQKYLNKKEYYYSSDVVKSQLRVMLENFTPSIKFHLNSYFFMIAGSFSIITVIILLQSYFNIYTFCHFKVLYYYILLGIVLFMGIQFYVEYYVFLLPNAKKIVAFIKERNLIEEPINLPYAIDLVINNSSKIFKTPLDEFLTENYPNLDYSENLLKKITDEDLNYFKNHPLLVSFLVNNKDNLFYLDITNNSNSETKIFVVNDGKEKLVLELIDNNSFKHQILNEIENRTKQQIVDILDVFAVSFIVMNIFC